MKRPVPPSILPVAVPLVTSVFSLLFMYNQTQKEKLREEAAQQFRESVQERLATLATGQQLEALKAEVGRQSPETILARLEQMRVAQGGGRRSAPASEEEGQGAAPDAPPMEEEEEEKENIPEDVSAADQEIWLQLHVVDRRNWANFDDAKKAELLRNKRAAIIRETKEKEAAEKRRQQQVAMQAELLERLGRIRRD